MGRTVLDGKFWNLTEDIHWLAGVTKLGGLLCPSKVNKAGSFQTESNERTFSTASISTYNFFGSGTGV
jgi:hypothetical protein